VDYYADAEGGQYLADPDHADLVGLVRGLNSSDNTFFVVFPENEDLGWAISVHTRRGLLGGYEIEREDPRTGEHSTTTTAADPSTIATDVLEWASHR
jgi:hypothetical protein